MKVSLVHPVSHTQLTEEAAGLRCPQTGEIFSLSEGVPVFVPQNLQQHMLEERGGMTNFLKTQLRRSPRLYLFLIFLLSPVCYSGISAKKFLRQYTEENVILNIGSGVHKPVPYILNIDIFYYKGVDIVANAEQLPFADKSVDAIVCESLLEHVPKPMAIVHEMFRVLKPKGKLYIVIPFVYPFHACPNDFYRWSHSGIQQLCKEGDIEKVGTRAGPSSALMGQITTWFAIALSFGYEPLYEMLSILLLLVFFPIKFLDLIIARFPTSIHGAGQFYIIATKKS